MRTRMNKPALLLSLLAVGALGLVACGGGDDEDSATAAKASADTTTEATARPDTTTAPPRSWSGGPESWLEAKLSPLARRNVREQVQELKAKLPREQVQELKRDANTEAKLSREQVQALEREANEWARDFSRGGVCDKYMGQPTCAALGSAPPDLGERDVSEAFQESFADATVEDIESERIELAGWADHPLHVAAVKFSNGEVVVFSGGDESFTCAGGGSACIWSLADNDHNRRFIRAATTPPS
jgi:hypothetical protein